MIDIDLFMALQIGGIAFFVSLAVTGFAALAGLGDIPDGRSAHSRVTPTGGGIGILAGIGAGLCVAALFHADRLFAYPGMASRLATLLSIGFAFGVIGLVDDRYIIPTKIKLLGLFLLCLVAAHLIGPVTMLPFGADHIYLLWWSGLIGSALWLFTVANGVNFMDGINGLFGTTMAVASGVLCAVAFKAGAMTAATLSGTLCAALLAFLPYNLKRRANVFSGDVGSLSIAFLYAGSVLILVSEAPDAKLLYVGPLLILPLLADVLLTLLRKPFKGIRLTAPHSTHIYQRLARRLNSHVAVSLIYAGVCAALGALALYAQARGTIGSLSGLLLLSGLMGCFYLGLSSALDD